MCQPGQGNCACNPMHSVYIDLATRMPFRVCVHGPRHPHSLAIHWGQLFVQTMQAAAPHHCRTPRVPLVSGCLAG